MTKQILLFLALALFPFSYLAAQGANFTVFPSANQLFQRDMASNAAAISIQGTFWQAVPSVRVKVFQENVLFKTEDFPTTAVAGQTSFDFKVYLPATLAHYRVETYALENGMEQFLRSADGILSGDAYLVMGQSNAVAGYGNITDNRFMRMYSWGGWQVAQPTIGMWQIEIATELIEKFGIPIAFINTAVSGSYMSENMPGTPIFEGTRTLMTNADLGNHIRGFFWFQGESDASSGFTADYYLNSYRIFDTELEQMIRQIDRKYIIQIRNGCWGQADHADPIREIHRQIPDILDNYGIMSTQGLEHDGCHFGGYGYQTLGKNLARVLGRDLYNAPNLPNIDAPNPHHAFLASPTELKIVTRDGRDALEWRNAQSEFHLNDANGVYIIGGSASNSVISLQLSGALPPGATVTYNGHGGGLNVEPVVRNANKVGILAFHALEILQAAPAEVCTNGVDDDGNGLTDIQDAGCDCLTDPNLDCEDFDCTTLYIGVDSTQIKIENTIAPMVDVKVYDTANNLVHSEIFTDSLPAHVLPALGSGTFRISVHILTSFGQYICQKTEQVTIAGGPTVTGCGGVTFVTSNSAIQISGLTSPIVFLHLFNKDWALVDSYLEQPTGSTMEFSNLPAGNYHVKVTLATANWQEICVLEQDVALGVSPPPPPPSGSGNCMDILIEQKGAALQFSNLENVNRSIQVWNPSWGKIYDCLGDLCVGSEVLVPTTVSGKYYVKIEYFTTDWVFECVREEEILISNNKNRTDNEQDAYAFDQAPVLRVYPNPSLGFVQIEAALGELSIQDVQGKTWFSQKNKQTKTRLDLDYLPKGVYVLRWEGEGKVLSQKIVLF